MDGAFRLVLRFELWKQENRPFVIFLLLEGLKRNNSEMLEEAVELIQCEMRTKHIG
jgi:hypothetical protein